MKTKLPVMILSVLTFAASTFGQTSDPAESTPQPFHFESSPTEVTAPEEAPAEVTDTDIPNTDAIPVRAAEAEPGEAAVVPGTDVVPLIVIDEVPLTDAIRNLARQSRLNFQFDPRITHDSTGSPTNQPLVSIRFENVSAQEALQAVLDNYNLKIEKDPRSRIARITIKDPAAPEPLVAKIVQLRYSDPTNLVTLVRSTLSPRSQVVADPRTSQLLITTTEKEMGPVLELIDSLDAPTKQVLIEAHLFESSRSPESVRGIDWSGTFAAQNLAFGNNLAGPADPFPAGRFAGDNGTRPGGTVPRGPRLKGQNRDVLAPTKVLLDTANGSLLGPAFLDASGVNAVLSFLNTDAETEVVATPRAVTLDNQTAILSVTRAFPVFNVTPGSANSPAGAQVTYTNLGTILQVTPRIAADDNIALRVIPEVSNIDSVDSQVLNGEPNTANIYAIRRIEANVMIPSGNTLVMGGLIDDRKTTEYVKVPILGDIPGLGLLFQHRRKVRNKSNLLIFITPTIVEQEDFHIASTGVEFLRTRVPAADETPEDPLDSAKPHDWTKPVY